MSNGFYKVPVPTNEPVLNYAPGSPERKALKLALGEAMDHTIDVPMYIGDQKVTTDKKVKLYPPHDHEHTLGHFNEGESSHVTSAINAALAAHAPWASLPWEERAAVFLKAADLIAGPYRYKINAATMLGQSKNAYQAEIDSACELIDFLRFNVSFMTEIYEDQPQSSPGTWNRMEQRSLEGFVLAITPFNFTAIAGNLPSAPALMGNVVVWKPAFSQIYAASLIMEVFLKAGLPPGVINLVYVNGPSLGDVVFKHPDFAGLHFTGSTGVFKTLWKTIGQNIDIYKSYPRIVGETGGKDFILAHKTAAVAELATAIVRGAFEYQGQKCSAASRAYIPDNLWDPLKKMLVNQVKDINMGSVEDFSNFVNAVISENSFDKITRYIDDAKKSDDIEVLTGGSYDKSKGYFIQPTILVTKDPNYVTMCEEIFGPVLTIYVYQADQFQEILNVIDKTSNYALTGAIFALDRNAIALATEKLQHAAGNFYINDKPTGAVVGQQPFGGARGSGTNDKAGSKINLLKWVSPRTIKETFVPPRDFIYPFMTPDKKSGS